MPHDASPTRGAATPRPAVSPSHLRGPFKTTKMRMTAKDWARLRDPDGNSIVQHLYGDVIAVVFGENDEMEADRLRLLRAAPDLRDALAGLLALCEASLSPDSDAVRGPLASARLALQKAEASRGE